jgi:hypothetical protein
VTTRTDLYDRVQQLREDAANTQQALCEVRITGLKVPGGRQEVINQRLSQPSTREEQLQRETFCTPNSPHRSDVVSNLYTRGMNAPTIYCTP